MGKAAAIGPKLSKQPAKMVKNGKVMWLRKVKITLKFQGVPLAPAAQSR